MWLDVIPKANQERAIGSSFRVCQKHWPDDSSFVRVQGGGTKPTVPPSVFEVPNSLLPSKKPTPRKEKVEFASQSFFDNKARTSTLRTTVGETLINLWRQTFFNPFLNISSCIYRRYIIYTLFERLKQFLPICSYT